MTSSISRRGRVALALDVATQRRSGAVPAPEGPGGVDVGEHGGYGDRRPVVEAATLRRGLFDTNVFDPAT